MKNGLKYTFLAGVWWMLLSFFFGTNAKVHPFNPEEYSTHSAEEALALLADSVKEPEEPFDPNKLKYRFKDESARDPLNYPNSGGFKLNTPSNVKTDVKYDPSTNQYDITQKVGDINYRPPTYMDQEEYQDYQFRQAVKKYWKQRVASDAEEKRVNKNLIPPIKINNVIFDRIFGGNTVDIRPQGSAELIFGVNVNHTENPAIPVKNRTISTFDFNEKIQLNVVGKIGEKLKLTTNYNTEATFDFENQMKLEYTGTEDEIIKKIEAGNVNLPLSGSLITGSQSLFGIKTQLQFGALTATTVFSQQRGKKQEVEVKGGAQTTRFEIQGDNYEANKHYFLSYYFRDEYDNALKALPVINSGVNITKIEVWITNRNAQPDNTRNIVGFADIGEDGAHFTTDNQTGSPQILDKDSVLPRNGGNTLYENLKTWFPSPRSMSQIASDLPSHNFQLVKDYEKLESAKKLASTEFTFNPRLGFISLNQSLNYDEVLAVAYQYTYNGKVYQVGEFSTDGLSGQEPLFLKLLKATRINTHYPIWDLMMKNVYAMNAYQVNANEFRLDVIYANPATGVDINYIPEGQNVNGKPLINVLGLDKLTAQNQPIAQGDGVFDFLDGITIIASNGRIFFPSVEPFGKTLRDKFNASTEQQMAKKYVFQELYDSTRNAAQQFPNKNRFKLKGSYQSASSSDISLGAANVPQGSVTVTAGGIKLNENLDYTVDYSLGRVKIINEGILNSGTPIKISLESNSLFSIQSKTMMGAHFDYRFNKDFTMGATIMNLTERPLTQKITIGDEPISNTVFGFDGNYRTEAPFLTRWVDKIPGISTKEMSTITAQGEYAQLIPGHSSAIGSNGNSYLDDFEGSISRIDLKQQGTWFLASTPQGQAQAGMFPEGELTDSLPYGYNRAKLAWYTIDPLFMKKDGLSGSTAGFSTPDYYSSQDKSKNFVREIVETEIFPQKQSPTGQPLPLPTLDLAFYPSERGPYNFDVDPVPGISKGLNPDGTLKNPETRWAGIMRRIETNDFEAANIEYIQFWMMDPFQNENTNPNNTGYLYFNLGDISEDVLKDSRKSFENGLPTSSSSTVPYVESAWGRTPLIQSVVNAFDNNPDARKYQDVGYDGLNDENERDHFKTYLDRIVNKIPGGSSTAAYANATSDPSADNYHYYLGDDYLSQKLYTLDRYKLYNGADGNSPVTESNPSAATTIPNSEDINRDNTMNETESYYQYRISLRPSDFQGKLSIGKNYITDVVDGGGTRVDGTGVNVKWYQFKIPIRDFEEKIGSIQDFKSIRFMRMFFKGVDKPIVCRFARLELIRGEWRKYNFSLLYPNEYLTNDDDRTSFDVTAVNFEENGTKSPVNYVLPPGIDRQTNVQTANLVKLNEQSLAIRVCNLEDGDARAIFKNSDLDVRSFKKLRLYSHAEALDPAKPLRDGDVTLFVRLGTDYTNNYYEYEFPLQVTLPGQYNGGDENDQNKVWPYRNQMILEFEALQYAKQNRNNNNIPLSKRYTVADPNYSGNLITVLGNPNLSTIKTIMIGVRNSKKGTRQDNDDGLAKCAEVWVNELRLTDFDEYGGWASVARVTAKLADFANITLAGNMSTPGYGSIEKKVSERQRETIQGYDVSSTIQLGKFLPERFNVKLPMYVGYSEQKITPQYNPLDPDILLDPYLNNSEVPQAKRDSLSFVTVDYTRRRSINFTDVRKNKGKSQTKSHPYDVENFAFNYAYNELNKRNINIEYNNQIQHRGGFSYNYQANPKNIKPFDKVKAFSNKNFALIKDFNFTPFPNKYGFTTDINRQYNELKNRNNLSPGIIIVPTYNKTFSWSRIYDLKWDVSKSLKIDFMATNEARVLEPYGAIDTEAKRDSIRNSFLGFGQTNHYKHTTNVNYTVPINKVPLLDFTSLTVRYSANYDWTMAPLAADSIGNTIQNSNTWQWNGQFNMTTLYNKVPYFKKINQQIADRGKPKPPKPKVDLTKAVKDSTKAKVPVKDTTENQYEILEYISRGLMSVKNLSFTFSENGGTVLPGYKKRTNILGYDNQFEGPTTGFLFGSQDDIRPEAIRKDWLVKTPFLNTPYTTTYTNNFTARANIEPLPDFKIELNVLRNYAKNYSEMFRWNSSTQRYEGQNPSESGNFSMSYFTLRTAFESDNADHTSAAFQSFLDKRAVISNRLGALNPYSGSKKFGFADGYSSTSQDVLIPAFLAGYAGQDEASVSLNPFPAIPLPNWRVTYDGFSKMEFVKRYVKTLTLSHAYRSTYSVGSYAQNLLFTDDGNGFTNVRDAVSNFVTQKQISGVSISEQFAPFLKVDMTWNNSLITNFEYKKERNLNLALTNYQLTELNSREIIVGAGYRLKDIPFFKLKLKGKQVKSDINLKVDISFRNNLTIIRKVVEQVNQVTAGQNLITIKTSADYIISDRLNLRFFYDHIINTPQISTSFPTYNISSGISIRFTLAQ